MKKLLELSLVAAITFTPRKEPAIKEPTRQFEVPDPNTVAPAEAPTLCEWNSHHSTVPLGADPRPLTDDLLTRAVDHGVVEPHDLDWEAQPPAIRGTSQSDFPRDVAAMAKSGGATIINGD